MPVKCERLTGETANLSSTFLRSTFESSSGDDSNTKSAMAFFWPLHSSSLRIHGNVKS